MTERTCYLTDEDLRLEREIEQEQQRVFGYELNPRQLPRRLIDTDSRTRKTFPMAAGLLDYFPDALAAVAQVSWLGNEQHNPGKPPHWSRGKSMDHADCIVRHLIGRGGFDGKIRHSAALAWRALALLQEELEQEHGLSLPRNAWVDSPEITEENS